MKLKTGFRCKTPAPWKDLLKRHSWLIDSTAPPRPKRPRYEDCKETIRETFEAVRGCFFYVADPKGDWGALKDVTGSLTGRALLQGDCDGFVLAIFEKLAERGLPVTALRWLYCKTETNEGHMIGIVETDTQSVVIDCRRISPATLEAIASYDLIMASTPKGHWVTVMT